MTTSDSTATRDLVATARAITEREMKIYAERTQVRRPPPGGPAR